MTLSELARHLREELDSGWLSVGKFRTSRGYVRQAITINCAWYRRLCGSHQSARGGRGGRARRPRTLIKRGATVAALDRMRRGNCDGVYVERILRVAVDVGFITTAQLNRMREV